MTSTPTRPLGDGNPIPLVGFGTYLIADEDAESVVGAALTAGYRHIDTAEGYGNERGVGAAIRGAIENGVVTRDQLFVTTKLWPGNPAWGQTPKDTASTIAALDASLERLGLDFVDLYLIHAPYEPEHRLAQWRGLVELQRQGKARSIGVSNFRASHIEQLRNADLPLPAANQIELHPWSQKPQLVGWLEEHGIAPIAYSSLIPLSTWRATPGQSSGKTDQMKADGASADSPFKVMAARYGVSEAQVLLRWAVQKGYPVLPKTTNPERMRANLDLFPFELDTADMDTIATMDRGDGVAWATGDPSRVD